MNAQENHGAQEASRRSSSESPTGSGRRNVSPKSGGRPKIGDSRPGPTDSTASNSAEGESAGGAPGTSAPSRSKRSGSQRRRSKQSREDQGSFKKNSSSQNSSAEDGASLKRESGANSGSKGGNEAKSGSAKKRRRRRRGGSRPNSSANSGQLVQPAVADGPVELDEKQLNQRRGRTRNGQPIGRYTMIVSKRDDATHIAVLEGRNLIEYYVSRPSDDVFEIHGNIYNGKVQNVLPGMEAAFVDIGTPKNAVLYRADVNHDKNSTPSDGGAKPKIEDLLKARQSVLCQVTKNPIAHKGARLTTEISLPGRFVVLVPNSDTYGISKRLPDSERKRLRQILDKVKPKKHGLIVRTAAENVTAEEIKRDIAGLVEQWEQISSLSAKSKAPSLLYREPDMSTRLVREEFNKEYRRVTIDDRTLFDEVSEYVSVITPALADRVEFYDADKENLPVFERFHVHEQLHKALDRKVWLPSGGSLIIEGTEALTVVDVNTGKNVGSSSLEETVFRNNLEAAQEVAHQLRLRDIGGIIVIDFVDMEDKKNRAEVMKVFRQALSQDKTRTQVFNISELGLAEMTRKRIGEGLLESLSETCPHCVGLGRIVEDLTTPMVQ